MKKYDKSQHSRTLQTSPKTRIKDISLIDEEREKSSKTSEKICLLAAPCSVAGKSQAEHMGQDPISCSRPDRLLGESSCSDNVLI